MPSKSYIDFLELLVDVHHLRVTHLNLSNGRRGRKNLGYLTRSAIVMLCAAWERYNENLLLECIDIILGTGIEAKQLSKHVKEYLSDKVKDNKSNIYPIELADNGWKNLWKGYAINETNLLHTPNSYNLNLLFKRFIGLDDFTNLWHHKSVTKINEFIKIRGEIAHKGSKAKYVRFNTLLSTIDTVIENTIQIDSSLSRYLKTEFPSLNTWEESYSRTLSDYR